MRVRGAAVPPGPVLIVAENASARIGGEAAIPLTYFRLLRERGADAYLLVHERCRAELQAILPNELGRMRFIRDTKLQYWLWRASRKLPARLENLTFGFAIQFITQLAQRHEARRMVRELGIAVVHQPTPVSPRMPSMIFGVGAPVVIGPMNGDMSFPVAFRKREHALTRWIIATLRGASGALHLFMPGKRKAAVLLVSNERTHRALPQRVRGEVMQFCENGVDLSLWKSCAERSDEPGNVMRVAFAGRLVELKGVDLLLDAAANAKKRLNGSAKLELNILGDGPEAAQLKQRAQSLGLNGSVRFHGWQTQSACAAQLSQMDALVLPSLCECGGAVVLEAMAMGLPVIASKWGGPADYLDGSCGMLVEPTSREAFVAGLENAMVQLATSPELREELGRKGKAKVQREFDWSVRIDHMIGVYHRAVALANKGRSEEAVDAALIVPS